MQTLFDEAISFPNAAHDDQVDAMVGSTLYKKILALEHPHDPYYSDSDNTYKNKATIGRYLINYGNRKTQTIYQHQLK